MANDIRYAEPTLASLLGVFKDSLMMNFNCHQVGEIVSFDHDTQTAEVQIKMLKVQNGELKDYAVLIDCPCIVLSGGKGRLTFPIEPGDSCLVLFNDRDIDNWYAGGQKMQPRTERMHSYSDAIALVGIRNLQNKITDYLAYGTELKYGESTIKLQDNKVTITNGTSTEVLENNKVTITNQTSTAVMDGNTLTVTAPIINVNGNMNVTQNTVDDNSLCAYIISSYRNGTDWYRVYSDGWCEQGGFATSSNVYLLKPMADTNYSVMMTQAGNSAYAAEPINLTTTGFTYWQYQNNFNAYWEVKGFVAGGTQ